MHFHFSPVPPPQHPSRSVHPSRPDHATGKRGLQASSIQLDSPFPRAALRPPSPVPSGRTQHTGQTRKSPYKLTGSSPRPLQAHRLPSPIGACHHILKETVSAVRRLPLTLRLREAVRGRGGSGYVRRGIGSHLVNFLLRCFHRRRSDEDDKQGAPDTPLAKV